MGLTPSEIRAHLPGGQQPKGAVSASTLRAHQPIDLIAGSSSTSHVIVRAQASLALGAALLGLLVILLPHPPEFNIPVLLAIQGSALGFGLLGFLTPRRVPSWLPRIGPAIATVNTTLAVIFSGDSTSAFVMFYLWIGLYAFYFPRSRREAAAHVLFGACCYGVAIALTPGPSVASQEHAAVSFFVVAAGTLVTAGILLTYLRGRMERLVGRLTDAARTDPLTGLPNHVGLRRVLESELERALPDRRPLSLLVIDIDRFKDLNDHYGIEIGDQVLQRFGSGLHSSARLMDTVARSGGEEFAVALPETTTHHAFAIAEEILREIGERFAPPAIELTASVGVANFPEHADDIGDLITAGDEALQAAKVLGGDRAVIYSPEVTGTLNVAAGRRSVEGQAHLATVLSLAEALDQRDTSTAKHSQTVGQLCEAMASELDLPAERVQRIRLAGILHDIGKIGISDVILGKAGPLTDEERAQMRRHPEIGARILASKEMDDIRSWIVAHHERPDGSGYPNGLAADEIPLEASIVAVADAYEAMTADRVYRPALGEDYARDQLRSNAGTQFDPDVVAALLRALEGEQSWSGLTASGSRLSA